MDRPRQLVVVRHAQSARNEVKDGSVYFVDDEARKSVRGIPDHRIPLTEVGHRQARQTGAALRERFGVFDYVYHSGYRRTIDTATGLLQAYPPDERGRSRVRTNPFIRERDPGFAYDMTAAEAQAAFPWLDEYWTTFGGFLGRPPGGESLADVMNRVHMFLDMLFRDRAGANILVVTHGGPLRCLRFLLERWDYEQAVTWNGDPQPDNCGVTVYEYDDAEGRLVLRQYNTVYHDAAD